MPPPKPAARGNLKLVVGAAALLAACAGGGYWWLNGGGRPAPKPALTTAPEEPVATTPTASEPAPPAGTTGTEPGTATPTTAAEPEAQAGVPDTSKTFRDGMRSGGQGPLMVWIPSGGYMMGAPDNVDEFSERPQHPVRIRKFAMSVYEVTIGEFARYASGNGIKLPKVKDGDRAKLPMYFVSWSDAVGYAKWLSAQTGHTYRLPTEAEWEYAARANTSTSYWWGREIGKNRAHCFACESGLDPRAPTEVGRFKPNPFGLYDTAGNVQEWTSDCYHPNYDGAPDDGSVFEGGDCTQHVVRGGGYSNVPKALRSTARDKFRANAGNDSIGIRLVRSE